MLKTKYTQNDWIPSKYTSCMMHYFNINCKLIYVYMYLQSTDSYKSIDLTVCLVECQTVFINFGPSPSAVFDFNIPSLQFAILYKNAEVQTSQKF